MDPNAELDNLMQGRLYEHSVAPPAFVWTNIEQELRKRRRRKGFFWLFFGLGLTATGLWALDVFERAPVVQPVEQLTPAQPAAATKQPAAVASVENAGSASVENTGTASVETPGASNNRAVAAPGKQSAPVTGLVTQNAPMEPAIVLPGTPEYESAVNAEAPTPVTELKTADFTSFKLLPPAENQAIWKRPAPTYPKVKPIVRRKQESKNCYDFDHIGTVWWLDAYAGPSITRRQFRAKDSEFDNYLQQRLETETPDLAFNAGVRASMLFRENFLVRTGLHYDQFVEKFEWADPNSIEVITRTRTQLVNGVWETVIDTLSIEYGDNYIKTYNRFGTLDIPLEAGIELRRGRTGVSINGGVSVNLLFWKRGAILSPDNNQPAYFTPGEGTIDVFKTNVGLSISGSVQWFYHIKPTLRLFAEPYYRQVLQPLTVDGHPVEQQYGIGGLKIGMTKILHGK